MHKPVTRYLCKCRAPQKKSADFSISSVQARYPSDSSWGISSEASLEVLEPILRQKFTYLDSGVQCFAFLSEDKQYVLKFFKQKKFIKSSQKRLDAFSSYKIAYEHFREETGLLFVHLVPGDGFSCRTTLIDHQQIEHNVELGEFEFLLQKRADLIMPVITAKMRDHQEQEALQIIDALFAFFHKRLEKGILDDDPNIPINLALLGDKIIQIDTGRFSLAHTPQMYTTDLARFRKKNSEFAAWLKQHYPCLYCRFQQQEKVLKEHYAKKQRTSA